MTAWTRASMSPRPSPMVSLRLNPLTTARIALSATSRMVSSGSASSNR